MDVCCDLCQDLNGSVRALGKYAPGLDPDVTDQFWELEDCAPAIWELLERRPGLGSFITSVDDLQYCLKELFPQYMRQFSGDQNGESFPKDGASIRFLDLPFH